MNSLTKKVILCLAKEDVKVIPTPENAKNWPAKRDALQIGGLIVDRIWETSSPAEPWHYMGVHLNGVRIDSLVSREEIWPTARTVLATKLTPLEVKSELAVEQILDQILAEL